MGALPIVLIFFALFAALAIWGITWESRRSGAILRRWAAKEGCDLLQFERRHLRTGPFFWWRQSKGQVVFRVLVRDRAGRERRGYVRVGGWFLGLWSDACTAEWDDER